MKLADIKKRKSFGRYHLDIALYDLKDSLDRYVKNYKLELCPDFQRGHVWTINQQIAFCEFILSGGKCPPILFNYPDWLKSDKEEYFMVCVDGLQRLTALVKMLDNKLKVFGHYLKEYEDYELQTRRVDISLYINELVTKKEILEWYLELNDGGTPHKKSEISKVKDLLHLEELKNKLGHELGQTVQL